MSNGFDLDAMRKLFKNFFADFERKGYYQEHLGYHCVDAGNVPGSLGQDLEGALLLEIRKKNLTPIHEKIFEYSEDDLFDVIEFLHEYCSKPVHGTQHTWNDCGWHYSVFEKEPGQAEFRAGINELLALYEDGYELSPEGEILALAENGLDGLFDARLPIVDPDNVEAKVAAAITKFRRYRSTIDERKDAIRDLADVLEYLRPKFKGVITSQDESDLFNIANNFSIRHHNNNQKTDYDKPIWYSWMFYHYLATIHALTRIINKTQCLG